MSVRFRKTVIKTKVGQDSLDKLYSMPGRILNKDDDKSDDSDVKPDPMIKVRYCQCGIMRRGLWRNSIYVLDIIAVSKKQAVIFNDYCILIDKAIDALVVTRNKQLNEILATSTKEIKHNVAQFENDTKAITDIDYGSRLRYSGGSSSAYRNEIEKVIRSLHQFSAYEKYDITSKENFVIADRTLGFITSELDLSAIDLQVAQLMDELLVKQREIASKVFDSMCVHCKCVSWSYKELQDQEIFYKMDNLNLRYSKVYKITMFKYHDIMSEERIMTHFEKEIMSFVCDEFCHLFKVNIKNIIKEVEEYLRLDIGEDNIQPLERLVEINDRLNSEIDDIKIICHNEKSINRRSSD